MTVAPPALVHADRWLSDVMGYPVFRVDVASGADDPGTLRHSVSRHAETQPVAMYFAKVPTRRVDVVAALAGAGLSVIDAAVTFRLDHPSRTGPAVDERIRVDDLVPDQAAAVLDIAGSCFRYSRFHLDPNVPPALAHLVKREWIASYVRRQRGECLLVATLDGQPAGFLAVVSADANGSRVRAIDLVGVAGWAQRRGVGRALVRAFIERFHDTSGELRVGTQVANIPSVRLYEQLGFSLVSSEYVLHGHRGEDVVRARFTA